MKITVHCINKQNMAYWGVPENTLREMDFEADYLPGCVAAEMGDCKEPEALKAQAVAARSFAYQYILKGAAIYDTGKAQAFLASRAVSASYKSHRQAAEDTFGIIITYNGKPVTVHYSASNGGYVQPSSNAWEHGGYADQWDDSASIHGHGSGMSQNGAENMAKAGKTHQEILQFYYPGTALMGEYGKALVAENITTEAEVSNMEPTNLGLTVAQAIQTKNLCYIERKPATQRGILVHSTGAVNRELRRYVDAPELVGKNQYDNHWNRAMAGGKRFTKMVHAFVGYDKTYGTDKNVIVVQTLPYDIRCWGCARGSKGSYNFDPQAHIQFEICEGSKTDAEYYHKAIDVAAKYCALLCQQFGFPVSGIVSHKEAHALGYANNHGDPESWMVNFGDDMHKFRARVAAFLGQEAEPETPVAKEAPVPAAIIRPMIYMRSSGNDSWKSAVRELQTLLNQKNEAGLKVDGIFGKITRKAVVRYQEMNGLVADGICGVKTWSKLTA